MGVGVFRPLPWNNSLGGTGSDAYQGVVIDSTGDICAVGFTASQGSGGNDCMIAKFSNNGSLLWQRCLGGTSSDVYYGVATDSNNNLYAAGFTASQGAGGNEGLIVKYNSSGTLQWQRSLGGANSEIFYGITVDSASNVYVVGSTASQGAGADDLLLAKYSSAGAIQWQRSLGGANSDVGAAVAVDNNDNIYVTGISIGTGNQEILVAKFNNSGVAQWYKTIPSSGGSAFGDSIVTDDQGYIYVSGLSTQTGGGGDAGIFKFDTSGSLQWQRRLYASGTTVDRARGIAFDPAGFIYVCGSTGSDLLIAKYDVLGVLQWQRTLAGSGSETGYSIAFDKTQYLYVCGLTSSQGAGGNDALIVRLNSNGSRTGTYGSLTYSASSLTDAETTFTVSSPTLTDASRTLTDASRTLTDTATTLTSTTTEM